MSTLPQEAQEREQQLLSEVSSQWKAWYENEIDNSAPAEREKFYLTTAINYTNGSPHIGHAYEAVCADIIARYHRVFGRKTFFLTGTDEHGQKIAQRAESENLAPIELCNRYANEFQNLNKRLLISNNRYIRTTEQQHYKVAQTVLEKAKEAGDIYLSKYVGWYNVKEEAFITETEAALSDFKDPSTGVPLVKMEEESYFFKLSKFQERLVNHMKENPTFAQPETQREFLLKRLEEPLLDLSISRTNFNWGIPFPFDTRHVMYVWFDALTNYLTGVDWPEGENKSFWPPDLQVIGKDISWFHCVIWPCMLFSAGIDPPKSVFSHGFINDENGEKMSKTKNNVVDPHTVLDKYAVDSFRLYLIHDSPFGNDLAFSEASLIFNHNADLADTIGNLVNRLAAQLNKAFKSIIPSAPAEEIFNFNNLRDEIDAKFKKNDLTGSYQAVIAAVKEVNGYLTTKEPWKIKDDPGDVKKGVIFRSALEAIYFLAHLLSPFIPKTSLDIFKFLNTPPKAVLSLSSNFDNLSSGTSIQTKFAFSKIEVKKKEVAAPAPKAKAAPAGALGLSNLDLRVGVITKVWKHPASDKLWCEEIDIGRGEPLVVASGLQQVYTEEQMQGARILVICNLPPAKLANFVSNGMVLCAKLPEQSITEFVVPPPDAKPGDKVFVAGDEAEPLSAAQVKRKKIWEALAPKLKTDENLVATYDGKPIITSTGPCTVAKAKNAPIS